MVLGGEGRRQELLRKQNLYTQWKSKEGRRLGSQIPQLEGGASDLAPLTVPGLSHAPLYSLTSPWLHWLLCSLDVPSFFLPQGFYTFCSLCLQHCSTLLQPAPPTHPVAFSDFPDGQVSLGSS